MKNTSDMFTAKDMQKAMKDSLTCDGLDTWLRETLAVQFVRANANSEAKTIRVDTREVKWGQNAFKSAMMLRGFTVLHHCESRPCSMPYYEIGFQPVAQGGFRD